MDGNDDEVGALRRKYYMLAASMRMFASGAEVNVINPSVWFYLQQFHAPDIFVGLVQSMCQVGGCISVVVIGKLYDKTRRTRLLTSVTNIAEIIGNLIYSLGFSKYLLLLGRLISGLGEGFCSVVYAEIGSAVSASERLKFITFLEGGRVLGSISGPLLNFAFTNVHFHIGKWHIGYGASATLVLCFFWIMIQCLTYTFMYDMYREQNPDYYDEAKEALLDDVELPEEEYNSKPEEEYNSKSEVKEQAQHVECGSYSKPKRSLLKQLTLKESLKELLTAEQMIVIFADSWFWLLLGSGSALMPLVLAEDLHWSKLNVAIMYMIISTLCVISMVVFLHCLSGINEVYVLMACCTIQSVVQLLHMTYYYARPNQHMMAVAFVVSCVVYTMSAGPSMIVGRTLLTKLVHVENQGFTQGVYNLWVNVALSIGPVVGSTVLHRLNIWASIALIGYIAAGSLLFLMRERIDTRLAMIAAVVQEQEVEARDAKQ